MKINQKIKDYAVGFGISTTYALLASIAASLVIILIGRQFVPANVSLDILIQINFVGFLFISFTLFWPMFLVFQIISIIGKNPPPKNNVNRIGLKLRKMSLNNRQKTAVFLRWTTLFSLVIFFVSSLLVSQETLANPSYKTPLVNWISIPYFIVLTFGLIGKFLMNRKDWALYHLENYRKTKKCVDLEKTLRSYNKILGSTLSLKKLVALSQYVEEAFKIGNIEEVEKLDQKLETALDNLRTENVSKIDNNLIDLSELAIKVTEKHEKVLGFEPRYPLRILISEKLRSSLDRIFPQVVIFLVWIGFLLVLARFGIVNITLPP
jgi:hypothetical protein